MTCKEFQKLSITDLRLATRAERYALTNHFGECAKCRKWFRAYGKEISKQVTPKRLEELKAYARQIGRALSVSDAATMDPEAP